MSQAALAESVGVDKPTMSRIERGEAIPSGPQAFALGAWLDGEAALQRQESDAAHPPAMSMHPDPHTLIRSEDSDTSYRAACAVNRANAAAIHQWIIEQLSEHPEGATHENLWMLYDRLQPDPRTSQSGLRTRVSELVRGGVVRDSERRRTLSTGRKGIVWELVPEQEGNP